MMTDDLLRRFEEEIKEMTEEEKYKQKHYKFPHSTEVVSSSVVKP